MWKPAFCAGFQALKAGRARNGRVTSRRGYSGGRWWSRLRALTMATTIAVTTEVVPIRSRDTARKPPPLPSERRKRANPRMSKPAPIAATSFKGTFLAGIQSGFLRDCRDRQCNASGSGVNRKSLPTAVYGSTAATTRPLRVFDASTNAPPQPLEDCIRLSPPGFHRTAGDIRRSSPSLHPHARVRQPGRYRAAKKRL